MNWPQHTWCDLDNPGEGRRIAYRADTLRAVAKKTPKVLCSVEYARQRLTLNGQKNRTFMNLHVQGAIEVIACVRVPVSIAARHHDEKLALP